MNIENFTDLLLPSITTFLPADCTVRRLSPGVALVATRGIVIRLTVTDVDGPAARVTLTPDEPGRHTPSPAVDVTGTPNTVAYLTAVNVQAVAFAISAD